MDIKIKNRFILKPEFNIAVQNLLQTRRMPARTTIEVNTAIDELASHSDTLRKSRLDTVKRHAVLDENGAAKIDENGNYMFPDDAAKQECGRALRDIEEEYITIQVTEPVFIYDDEEIAPIELRLLSGLVQVRERPKPEVGG